MTEAALCETCKFFAASESDTAWIGQPAGNCGRWLSGYMKPDNFAPNDVLVENDEGWSNIVGAKFGCVLHEPEP